MVRLWECIVIVNHCDAQSRECNMMKVRLWECIVKMCLKFSISLHCFAGGEEQRDAGPLSELRKKTGE